MTGDNGIAARIIELKKERKALILAHYYQRLEVQEIADFVGDSFELSKIAKNAENDLIVFCGVRFMGESAKILSPEKTVLLPNRDAGCLMADMINPEDIRRLKAENPGAAVVCYVNSSAETKAEADVCCTSANAVKVVRSLDAKKIIFVPDKNLGAYVAKQVPEKEFIFHCGFCPVHKNISPLTAQAARLAHPSALLLAHPECEEEVLRHADFIGSTSAIIKEAEKSDKKEFIIGTEYGVLERLQKYNPDKKFYLLAPSLICTNMKKTTLENVLRCLENLSGEVKLPHDLIEAAYAPLLKMISIK